MNCQQSRPSRDAPPLVRWLMLGALRVAGIVLCVAGIHAQPRLLRAADPPPTREQAIEPLTPFAGASTPGVDVNSLTDKVLTGYQGWFNADGDGAGRGWQHYPRQGEFRPGYCSIDLWPDVSELSDAEKFVTPFQHADGTAAFVFSSYHLATVARHFRWMREYGIDGAFVQRFAVATRDPRSLRHVNAVLAHCRAGANAEGRGYALMYDLSGLPAGGTQQVIDDVRLLVDRMRLGRDAADRAYLRHAGRPLIAVWGVGFNDDRKYTLAECAALVEFLKHDPACGGWSVMLGVPTGWRTLDRDALPDPTLHDIIARADVISPWTIGRYATLADVDRHAERVLRPDLAWCRERTLAYLPVAFPGFSWHNMRPEAPLGQIPRLKGAFLWRQYIAARRAGCGMMYQAMFDELDEGTAIFKCANDPPRGESPFLTYGGLPADHYLWLTGQGGRLLRGEIPASEDLPKRE